MRNPSTKPLSIRFKNKKEEQEFLNWANSKEQDNSPEMQMLRKRIARTREMRKKGKIVV